MRVNNSILNRSHLLDKEDERPVESDKNPTFIFESLSAILQKIEDDNEDTDETQPKTLFQRKEGFRYLMSNRGAASFQRRDGQNSLGMPSSVSTLEFESRTTPLQRKDDSTFIQSSRTSFFERKDGESDLDMPTGDSSPDFESPVTSFQRKDGSRYIMSSRESSFQRKGAQNTLGMSISREYSVQRKNGKNALDIPSGDSCSSFKSLTPSFQRKNGSNYIMSSREGSFQRRGAENSIGKVDR